MRTIHRIMLAMAGGGILLLGLTPALPAAAGTRTVITVTGDQEYQYLKTCTSDSTCNQVNGTELNVEFQLNQTLARAITIGYQIVNGTAVDGVDFSTPMTGNITIPAHTYQEFLLVPVINEGTPEGTETFTVKMTSSSLPADISSVGTDTIYGTGNIPMDCNYLNPGEQTLSVNCTARPAGQSWYFEVGCFAFSHSHAAYGNTVVGDGTSTAVCSPGIQTGEAYFYSS